MTQLAILKKTTALKMNSITALSKEVLASASEISAQTEKMITPLPIPQKTSTGAWTAAVSAVPRTAPQEMTFQKTLSISRTARMSQKSSIEEKSSNSWKKTPSRCCYREILHFADGFPEHHGQDKHPLSHSSAEGCYRENFFPLLHCPGLRCWRCSCCSLHQSPWPRR